MRRDLQSLCEREHDILIIGGGITGAVAAWDAAMRGLSTALIEKADFGGATSAASGKIIHGGLRYLQHAELRRVRESLSERHIWSRAAPHMLQPTPFIVPTYRNPMRGPTVLRAGMTLYELLGWNCNSGVDPALNIPRHRMLSRREAVKLEPGLDSESLTGAALYYELVMRNPERLTLSVVAAAANAGAVVANYVDAVQFILKENRVVGVKACDTLSGAEFEIRAKLVLNAAGPWVDAVLSRLNGLVRVPQVKFAKGVHLITKQITNHAVALPSRQRYADALLSRGSRHLFIIPWRGCSLVGTSNVPHRGGPGDACVTAEDVEGLIRDINDAFPAAKLSTEDVLYAYSGVYRLQNGQTNRDAVFIERKPQLLDHSRRDGIEGLISAVAVKYTTARRLAMRAVDLACRKLNIALPPTKTNSTPVFGGDIEDLENLVEEANAQARCLGLPEKIGLHLVYSYGSRYRRLLSYVESDSSLAKPLGEHSASIAAEVVYAVREEMAQKLSDVVLRRTGLGTTGNPGESCLRECACIMAQELGWSTVRTEAELEETRTKLAVPGQCSPAVAAT
ncbi:MAG: glycerol-3-phosphate dehydrogenase/oxidase [Armatimonadota bacterium]